MPRFLSALGRSGAFSFIPFWNPPTNYFASLCNCCRALFDNEEVMPSSFRTSYAARPIACLYLAFAILFVTGAAAASDCIPIHEASRHVGETACVSGRVVKVKVGSKGVHFLDFCEDQMACPFSVVVFPHDLKDVGDVRRLAGHLIEINGPIKLYDGRAEIILNRVSQVAGGLLLMPPLPKDYDVEKQGHYSAGHLYSKKLKAAKPTPNSTATYGNESDVENP